MLVRLPLALTSTNIYQSLIGSSNWGGWLMLAGDDGSGNASFKAFDPDNSYRHLHLHNEAGAPNRCHPANLEWYIPTLKPRLI